MSGGKIQLSDQAKKILALLHKDKTERSIGWLARKTNMLYPSVHRLIDSLEYKHKLIQTSKTYNYKKQRLIKLTDKGMKIAEELE